MKAQVGSQEHWGEDLQRVAEFRDREAFNRLFTEFAPLLKSFGLSTAHLNSPQAFGDELVQEVMIKVWLRAGQFNPDKASVKTWLYSIARNTRIDMLRRQSRHMGGVDVDECWLEAEEGQPVKSLQQARAERSISEGLATLPPEQAEVVKKVYLEGKTQLEVAEESSLPLGTVKSRMRLAMKKLKLVFES